MHKFVMMFAALATLASAAFAQGTVERPKILGDRIATAPAAALQPLLARPPVFVEEFTKGIDPAIWNRCFTPKYSRAFAGCSSKQTGGEAFYVHRQDWPADLLTVSGGVAVLHAQRVTPAVRAAGEAWIKRSTPQPNYIAAFRKAKWMSSALVGRKAFLYGYVEFHARGDAANASWPALWLLPASGKWPPEIDVLEQFQDGHSYSSLHSREIKKLTFCKRATNPGFHYYGVLWSAQAITFFEDRKALCSFPTPADMHTPMYPLISLAVGVHAYDDTKAPKTLAMYVDSVKWWALPAQAD